MMSKYIFSIYFNFFYSEDKLYFILSGEITLVKKNIGKFLKISLDNTLGEESFLDKKNSLRKESAFVESENALLIELSTLEFQRVKEVIYELGLKKDFLMLESIMRRNFVNKKNNRL
jgi:hypothetical protein